MRRIFRTCIAWPPVSTSTSRRYTGCRHSMITTNKKGEEVKHPYVNIAREAWAQYLDVAKQYGLTIKSKAQIDSHKPGDGVPDTPLDEYIREKRTRG